MKRPAARRLAFPFLATFSAAIAASALAKEPVALEWPTDAGRCVTATFCEFRPDHFHSGIDISTWGKTGYRCLAAGDG
ncbi:M23 family peptidase, partial [bacterium]|nr:M23 family peptidase [bacterium]